MICLSTTVITCGMRSHADIEPLCTTAGVILHLSQSEFTTMESIFISAVKRLITSKIKVFVYIIYLCVLCLFIMYTYTHTFSIYFENIFINVCYILYYI